MAESIRVLNLDDDPDFADVVARSLEGEDDRLAVTTVHDPAGGLDELATNEVDCVVSDHDEPGVNGVEFLDTVRERHGDLPFVLYTGNGSEALASEAISRGVTDYLKKGDGPDQHTVLANRVVNCLGVKPRGFPWVSRTLPSDHRPDGLERSVESRSGRPRPPMPAVVVRKSKIFVITRDSVSRSTPSGQREGC